MSVCGMPDVVVLSTVKLSSSSMTWRSSSSSRHRRLSTTFRKSEEEGCPEPEAEEGTEAEAGEGSEAEAGEGPEAEAEEGPRRGSGGTLTNCRRWFEATNAIVGCGSTSRAASFCRIQRRRVRTFSLVQVGGWAARCIRFPSFGQNKTPEQAVPQLLVYI